MDKIEAVKQAFIMAYNGYIEATFEVEHIRTGHGLQKLRDAGGYMQSELSSLAPIAAEIYRQLTSVVVMEIGSSERRAGEKELSEVTEQLRKTNIKAAVVSSQDANFRVLANEYGVKILIEVPERGIIEDGA